MKKHNLILFVLLVFVNTTIAQIVGCTDPLANNYDVNATSNDGSCTYNATTITIKSSTVLDAAIKETSGLIEWDNFLYTHNDDTDTNIYKLNKSNGDLIQTIPLNGVQNTDWEEIAQDANFIYLGDFGNNGSGNRTDLKIYKISKTTLETVPQIEIINFSYSNQTDFTAQNANSTDFDCEAFVVTTNEILLFTKQWISKKTSVYSLPKTAGTYVANLITTLNVSGLVTGATIKEDSNLIVLCGYSTLIKPFLYLLYDYKDYSFSTANKRKLDTPFSLGFHQVEGIATNDGLEYNLTNEAYSFNKQKIHQLSLQPYLDNYLNTLSLKSNGTKNDKLILFPNPTSNDIHISNLEIENNNYEIINWSGQTIAAGKFENNTISTSDLESGIYLLKFLNSNQVYKIIKK